MCDHKNRKLIGFNIGFLPDNQYECNDCGYVWCEVERPRISKYTGKLFFINGELASESDIERFKLKQTAIEKEEDWID